MRKLYLEFSVGLFVVLGLAALFYMAVNIGGGGMASSSEQTLIARFDSASGLKSGGFVEISGVRVGKITSITLDAEAFEAVVSLRLPNTIEIPDDSIASIRTAGIIGDRFVKITPGGSDLPLAEGEEIIETESAISIEELISKYMFEGGSE